MATRVGGFLFFFQNPSFEAFKAIFAPKSKTEYAESQRTPQLEILKDYKLQFEEAKKNFYNPNASATEHSHILVNGLKESIPKLMPQMKKINNALKNGSLYTLNEAFLKQTMKDFFTVCNNISVANDYIYDNDLNIAAKELEALVSGMVQNPTLQEEFAMPAHEIDGGIGDDISLGNVAREDHYALTDENRNSDLSDLPETGCEVDNSHLMQYVAVKKPCKETDSAYGSMSSLAQAPDSPVSHVDRLQQSQTSAPINDAGRIR